MMHSPDLDKRHWAQQPERGNLLLMRITAWLSQRLGRRVTAPIVWLAVIYFYVFGRRARRSIAQYQRHLQASTPATRLFPSHAAVYRQYLAFAHALLDKLDCWQGKIDLSALDIVDSNRLHEQMGSGRGQVLVSSHLGNMEICRALARKNSRAVMNILIHDKHARHFNRLLQDAGADNVRLLQVSELDPATMLVLSERIERGEWLVIAGDRIPLHGARTTEVDFLSATAQLPQGPWLLAGLLRCPANLIFCTQHGARFQVTLERLANDITWTRTTRHSQVQLWAQAYADRLAEHCRKAPLQWFNFFPFWSPHA